MVPRTLVNACACVCVTDPFPIFRETQKTFRESETHRGPRRRIVFGVEAQTQTFTGILI